MRIVLDTNVLIDGFSDDFSYQARLIDAVRDGDITALVTPPVIREYRKILHNLIEDPEYRERIDEFLAATEKVEPQLVEIDIDDAEDYKFVQAAVGGQADLLVTNDRHLLDVGEVEDIHMVTPQEAWGRFEDLGGGSGEWESYVKGWGIGE